MPPREDMTAGSRVKSWHYKNGSLLIRMTGVRKKPLARQSSVHLWHATSAREGSC